MDETMPINDEIVNLPCSQITESVSNFQSTNIPEQGRQLTVTKTFITKLI